MNKSQVIIMSSTSDRAKPGKGSDRLATEDEYAVVSNSYFNKLAWKAHFGTELPERVKVTVEPA